MAKKNRSQNKTAAENSNNSQSRPALKQKSQLVPYFIFFVLGFLAGIAFTVFKSDNPVSGEVQTTAVQKQDQSQQNILNMEAEVTANPANFQAWIRLGHLYFDSNQPKKAIGAYTKSLELHTGDANLLTDLGVMYRRDKQPQKAIESFDKAIQKDKKHIPSRFNKGIVLLYDLSDSQGAINSWESILQINPNARTSSGEPMRQFIDNMKSEIIPKP